MLSARLFYERELPRISRPTHSGWARADCPFHRSHSHKSFVVNLRHGGYRCFGCGSHGDMIGFMRERYRMGYREACRALGRPAAAKETFYVLERHEDVARDKERRERIESSRRLRGLYKVWEVINANFRNEDIYYEFMTDLLAEIREAESDYDKRLVCAWRETGVRT